MKKINITIFVLMLGFLSNCSLLGDSDPKYDLSPLVKYRFFPMKKCYNASDAREITGAYNNYQYMILYSYYKNQVYQSYNGWISNSTYPFAFNPKGSVSLVSNGISYDTVYYPENGKLLVVWVSNATTNIFYEMTTNERYIHANRKYIAFQKGNMLYVIQTNGTTNWSHNVSFKNFIFRFANGDSPIFAYGEYAPNPVHISNNVPYAFAKLSHTTYIYNMDTTESNYFDQAQDIIGFSPKNNLLFYNKYNGYTYDAYGNINLLLTNSGMLAVYHIKEKQKQVIGDLTTETNRFV